MLGEGDLAGSWTGVGVGGSFPEEGRAELRPEGEDFRPPGLPGEGVAGGEGRGVDRW